MNCSMGVWRLRLSHNIQNMAKDVGMTKSISLHNVAYLLVLNAMVAEKGVKFVFFFCYYFFGF